MILPTDAEQIVRLILEVKRLRAELEDIQNSHKFVMAEDCPDDEKHCGCVPILKDENVRLRDQLSMYVDTTP